MESGVGGGINSIIYIVPLVVEEWTDWKGICINAIYMKRNGNQRAKVKLRLTMQCEQSPSVPSLGQSIKVCFPGAAVIVAEAAFLERRGELQFCAHVFVEMGQLRNRVIRLTNG